MTSQSKQA